MKFIIITYALLISSCTYSAEQTEESSKLTNTCVDTRDGETFEFKNNTVKNVRLGIGGADSCMTITDSTGEERTLCQSMEVYLKCETK